LALPERALASAEDRLSELLIEPVSSIRNGVRHLAALFHRSIARLAGMRQGGLAKIAAGFVVSFEERRKQDELEGNSGPRTKTSPMV
jgi:hypothetical protein